MSWRFRTPNLVMLVSNGGIHKGPIVCVYRYRGSEATDPLNALRTGFRSWMGNRITHSNTSESISRLFKFINHEGAKNTPHINATTWNAPHINKVGIRISFTHLGFVLIVPISSECMTNATDNFILNLSPCDYHSLYSFSEYSDGSPFRKTGFGTVPTESIKLTVNSS